MAISNGALSLIPLKEGKIEQVRIWRNAESTNRFLKNSEPITPEQQQAWFEKISKSEDTYLLINQNGKDIGLIYSNHYNSEDNSVETNVIIGDPAYIKSGISLKSCLLFTAYLFDVKKYSLLLSSVNKRNTDALKIDQFIGFQAYKENDEYIYLELDNKSFQASKGYQLLIKMKRF